MKTFVVSLIGILFFTTLIAQSPEKMSYQAVVRNSDNELVTNQTIGVQINILYGSADGVSVYSETHTATTNANGLMTLEIGNGTPASGDFSTILWSNGTYFLKTEIDPEGGSSYTISGTSQLLSVPYALHAKTAESISGTVDENDPVFVSSVAAKITSTDTLNWNAKLSEEQDGDATNELQMLTISNDTIYLSDGGFVKLPASVSFSGSFNDLDNIPAGLSDGDDNTQLDETAVDAFVANNGYLTEEVDGSITNEIQVLTISNDTIYLSGGGFVKLPASASFSGSFNDLDDIPANLDTDFTDDFDGAFTSLSAIPAGLSDGDDDTQLTEAEVDAYVANNGYLDAEVDGSVTNEIELPDQATHNGKFLTTNGTAPSWSDVSYNSLTDVPANIDTDATDDFDGDFTSLSNIPSGVSDGDDDTQLSEAEVDAFVANNGYLTSEVDGSITNEIELPEQSGHNGEYLTTDGSSVSWSSVSGGSKSYAFVQMTGNGSTSGNGSGGGVHTGSEIDFGDDSSPSSTTSGITWSSISHTLTVSSTGVYEISFNAISEIIPGDVWPSTGTFKIYVDGSAVNSISVFLSAWNGDEKSSNHINWVGSIDSGTDIKATFQWSGEGDSGRLISGSTLLVKEL